MKSSEAHPEEVIMTLCANTSFGDPLPFAGGFSTTRQLPPFASGAKLIVKSVAQLGATP